jgi:hypothetical protein
VCEREREREREKEERRERRRGRGRKGDIERGDGRGNFPSTASPSAPSCGFIWPKM